jgi:hypothetical protein
LRAVEPQVVDLSSLHGHPSERSSPEESGTPVTGVPPLVHKLILLTNTAINADSPSASAWLSGRPRIARAIASSSPSRSSHRPDPRERGEAACAVRREPQDRAAERRRDRIVLALEIPDLAVPRHDRARTRRRSLTGGATAVIEGSRESTVDVDLRLEPECDELLRLLDGFKGRLTINVELVSPPDFIPELPRWRNRSPFLYREGNVDVHHFDPHSQALSKIEPSFDRDLADVRAMLAAGLVERRQLQMLFRLIERELFRYPAVDPIAFRRRLEAVAHRRSRTCADEKNSHTPKRAFGRRCSPLCPSDSLTTVSIRSIVFSTWSIAFGSRRTMSRVRGRASYG